MAPPPNIKVLDVTQISPPPRTTADASLPLTYFDLLFLPFHPVQRLYLYEFPEPTSCFLDSQLPNLKHSLALTLQHFYPLAGKLVRSLDGTKPEICYVEGDSVSLTVAECDDDFAELSGNHVREATRFHSLVPLLPKDSAVLALQVTLFSNSGIGIGISIHHAVADGSTSTQFMKSWASVCRLGKKAMSFVGWLPFYDRSLIKDPKGLERIYLNDLETLKDDLRVDAWDLNARANNVVRATYVFSKDHLNRLGKWVFNKTLSECSPFALACGYIWVCLIKAQRDTCKKIEHFGFVSGCRARLNPPISPTFFGNCLAICRVEAKKSDLVGEDGVAAAAEAIWKVIQGLGEGGVFEGAENWVHDIFYCASKGTLTVAGSPKLGVYKTDFGWGRPLKVEVISIERTSALSLAESRDELEGIEIGLALSKDAMDGFASQFAKSAHTFS